MAFIHDDPFLQDAVNETLMELAQARSKFAAFNSAHEGYAVILEELDELWREVQAKPKSVEAMRAEAMQVAAMGLRFMIDICSVDTYQEPRRSGS